MARKHRKEPLTRPDWPATVRWARIDAIGSRLAKWGGVGDRFAQVLTVRRRPAELLDALDREARRLYSGDRSAAASFRGLLGAVADGASRPVWAGRQGRRRARRTLARMRLHPRAFRPLPPDGVVDPVAMLYVAEAAAYAAGSSRRRRIRMARALDFLWGEAARLDGLAELAADASDTAGERLAARLQLEEDLLRRPPAPGEAPAWLPIFPGGLGPTGLPGGAPDSFSAALRGHIVGKVNSPFGIGGPRTEAIQASNITSLSPNPACPGEIVTIRGTAFGATQPAEIEVVLDSAGPALGGIVLEVVSWSDTTITVLIPSGAGSGCIGLRNRALAAHGITVWKQQAELFGVLNIIRELQGLPPETIPLVPLAEGYLPAPVPCTGRNRFLGTLPEVLKFESNATPLMAGQPPVLEPGVPLVLAWEVGNADEVTVARVTGPGPALPQTTVAASGTLDLGPFPENQTVTATYRLVAKNRCGTEVRLIRVTLRAMPHLKGRGIEVAQTVQRFDVLGPAPRNTVRLAGRHRTVARVYLESGLSGGFKFAITSSPNCLPVTSAHLELTTASGVTTVDQWNPGVEIPPASELTGDSARTAGSLNALGKSINFLLPWDVLDGPAHLVARIETADGGPGTKATVVTDVLFQTRRRFNVIFVPIRDTGLPLLPPSNAEFVDIWSSALARLPLSEHHWLAYSVTTVFDSDHDLNGRDGWSDLLDDMVDLFDDLDLDENHHLLIGLVRGHPSYVSSGINGISTVGRGVNVAINQLPDASSLAHEVTHAFGIGHNACGAQSAGGTPDPSLPCSIEDVGVDLAKGIIHSPGPGSPDLMSTPSGELASVVLWERLFNVIGGG
jgi:hypothetical protein